VRRPVDQGFRRRRDENRVEGMVAIVGNAIAIVPRFEVLQAEGAAQPRGQGARPRENSPHAGAVGPALVRRIQRFESFSEGAAGPTGVAEIALTKARCERRAVLQQVIALLAPLDRQRLDRLGEIAPGLGGPLALEPFRGRAVALALIGVRHAQGLVGERIVAKTRPGQNMVDLDAVVARQKLRGFDPLAAIEAAPVLLGPQLETQKLLGAPVPPELLPKGGSQTLLLRFPPHGSESDLPARLGRCAEAACELDMDAVGRAMTLHDRLDLLDGLDERFARRGARDELARYPPLRKNSRQPLLAMGADVEGASLARQGGIVSGGATGRVVAEPLRESDEELSRRLRGDMRGARE
jgi:hypothetical protein